MISCGNGKTPISLELEFLRPAAQGGGLVSIRVPRVRSVVSHRATSGLKQPSAFCLLPPLQGLTVRQSCWSEGDFSPGAARRGGGNAERSHRRSFPTSPAPSGSSGKTFASFRTLGRKTVTNCRQRGGSEPELSGGAEKGER
ncbi:hypothetical protein FQA47_001204 [Oryzias melastigma]|uniref:Uncharacterized protein n=1 Tax=Oryzias melastigma TaxID=30732 RepID=A0A834FC15_ORYME|nr:hypothetical protein FQA47_001204 [Oryzias melastigma]